MPEPYFVVPFVILVVLCFVCGFLLTLFGNVAVLLVFLKSKNFKFRKISDYVIALAATDLLAGVICIPFAIYKAGYSRLSTGPHIDFTPIIISENKHDFGRSQLELDGSC